MEGTLPAMDSHLASTLYHGQSNEEMQRLLLVATLELDAARAEGQLHEAKVRHHEARVRHLEEVLKEIRKERDEYRDKCNQLQARLSRSPSLGSGLSDGITVGLSSVQQMESVSSMPEPTRATLSEVHRHIQEQQQQQQQQQQLEFQCMEMQQQMQNHPLDLKPHQISDLDDKLGHQLMQQLEMHHGDQISMQLASDMHSPDRQSASAECTDGRNPSSVTSTRVSDWGDFTAVTAIQQSRPITAPVTLCDENILNVPFMDSNPQGLNPAGRASHLEQHSSPSLEEFYSHLHQHQQQEQQMQQNATMMQLQLQQRQQRQESEQLLAHMQLQQRNSNTFADEQPCHSLSEGQDVGVHSMSVLQHSAWQMPSHSGSLMQNGLGSSSVSNLGSVPSFSMSSPPISSGHQAPQLLQNGSAVASILSPLDRYGDSPSSSLLPSRTLHLPEPPEADMQVILSTLPEKGKLLQAVMKAGPLLQTLLLAGPLPQWRHPPPAMDSVEIPRVSMSAASMTVPSLEHSSPGHAMGRNGSNYGQGMRMSMHAGSQNGVCHAMSMPVSSIAAGVNLSLNSQRSLPQRLPLSNSHLSHDISLLGPPLKYAKIH